MRSCLYISCFFLESNEIKWRLNWFHIKLCSNFSKQKSEMNITLQIHPRSNDLRCYPRFIAGILNFIAVLLDDNYWFIGVCFIWSPVEFQKHLRKKLILKWDEWKGNLLFESPCVLWCVWFLQDSFQMLKKWVKELKEHGPEDIVVAIAGNKTDLGDIRFKPSSSFWKCIILSKVSFQNLQPLSLYFHISCRMWSFYLKSTWNQNCRSN